MKDLTAFALFHEKLIQNLYRIFSEKFINNCNIAIIKKMT